MHRQFKFSVVSAVLLVIAVFASTPAGADDFQHRRPHQISCGDLANLNLPEPLRADDATYLADLDRALEWIDASAGSIVVVSLGFDTYEHDPIGDLALTTAGYHEMGRRVGALGRRLVILQEGGYFVPDLGTNAVAWLRGAAGRPPAG